MNLATAFDASVARAPAQTAICWGDAELSYAGLAEQSHAVARALKALAGVKPGDRVAIWFRNCPEFVAVLFGILRLGGVAVPINNFLKPDEVNYIVRDADARALITDQSMTGQLGALREAHPALMVLDAHDLVSRADAGSVETPAQLTENALAIIIYTSGTTGQPKGAMLSHGNLLHNVESCRQALGAVRDDRLIVLLPMFHSFMLCVGILLPLLVGGSMVLIRSLHTPKAVVDEIIRHRGTILPAIPQFFRALAALPWEVQLPLRLCISGAAPLPGHVLAEFNQRFHVPLLEGYGLSEASPVVSFNPVKGPWKAGSIGVPIPGVEMSVQDENGRHLGVGEVGEICVRGGNVMQGYWNQPAETAQTLRDGWLFTGDVGFRDADGYYFITDRKKDMLLVNGINVYPREIEEVLYQFPGVKEAAVVGMPDARKGEQPLAFISAADGVTIEEKSILQFLRSRLADYKLPRRVVVLQTLPRNATGKVLKTSLRQMTDSAEA
jgi:long-chain acyl-CoA synthetase